MLLVPAAPLGLEDALAKELEAARLALLLAAIVAFRLQPKRVQVFE